MGFLGMMGMNLLGGILGGRSQRSHQRRLMAQQRQRQYDAYALASKETPEEIKYRNRLLERATEGDPDIGKKQTMMMSPIMQQGQIARSTAQGMAIRQGLENSMIAHEIRSRVDQKTLQAVTTMAEKIAMHNDQYKKQYEDRLDSYQMQRSQRLRDLASGYIANQPIDQSMSNSEMFGSIFGNMMSSVSSGFMNSEIGQSQMQDFFAGGFNWN